MSSGYPGDEAFLKKLADQGAHLGNNFFLCTADGKVLGANDRALATWLAKWRQLPEAQRRPGAITIEDRGRPDPKKASPRPPENGLILKAYLRVLARDPAGKLYAPPMTREFYVGGKRYWDDGEPNRDFVWLTAAEWKALLPAQPKAGETVPMPATVRDRLFRFHLVDGATCLSWPWKPEHLRAGELTLTVEAVTAEEVRMRLAGFARLGPSDADAVEYRLLGVLSFDPGPRTFTRFDVVAVSETGHHDKTTNTRKPLGIAFELVRDDTPANRRPPRGTHDHGLAGYLGTGN